MMLSEKERMSPHVPGAAAAAWHGRIFSWESISILIVTRLILG